ncbi:hypothetical protein BC938DRAFT_478840 [Jimgerdemannia flammicorona]|uniref:Uncharacterized protein n=1 Tax=Jimgerdemannia flammicorona TaxID=994334 RepID=A0A433QM55_9FUNG|nr:hypothetical protein BC938DRAFT_478840 [Jimgerdemannia flammicorona]
MNGLGSLDLGTRLSKTMSDGNDQRMLTYFRTLPKKKFKLRDEEADKAEVLSDSSDVENNAESDDNGHQSGKRQSIMAYGRHSVKWRRTLKSRRAVEDIMIAYGVKLKEESLIHSWILDLSDTRLQGFDVFHLMFSIPAKADVRALRKKVLQSWLDPDVEYDRAKHGAFQYIHVVLSGWWSVIFDRCFEQLGVIMCIRRIVLGERNGRNEFGAIEVAKEFDGQTSTKWLKESFKNSKVMHDILVRLVGAVKNDRSSVRHLRTVGWLHFGKSVCTKLEMDWANDRVCHLVRREVHHVGQGLNPR